MIENLAAFSGFDPFPGVHDSHLLTLLCNPRVVRDKQDRALIKAFQQQGYQMLPIGCVHPFGGFIGDDEVRLRIDPYPYGQQHPLGHPSGKLVGEHSSDALGIGKPHSKQGFVDLDFLLSFWKLPPNPKRLTNLGIDAKHGMKASQRILRNQHHAGSTQSVKPAYR